MKDNKKESVTCIRNNAKVYKHNTKMDEAI